MKHQSNPNVWDAPERLGKLDHSMSLPGSKSQTNRELVLAALADGPSILRRPLHSRDTDLMREALRGLGAKITDLETGAKFGADWKIEPIDIKRKISGSINCGLAGTVMRFIPPLMATIRGEARFDGDLEARARPIAPTIDALLQLGLEVKSKDMDRLPFTVSSIEKTNRDTITIDSSRSSQFLSGFLLVGARLPEGLKIIQVGPSVPSVPHVDMTISCLKNRGVEVKNPERNTWEVSPGPISALDTAIESDLSNAAPFLAAAVMVGGQVKIDQWGSASGQVGLEIPRLLQRFGAQSSTFQDGLKMSVTDGVRTGPTYPGVDLDLSNAGELAPTLIVLSLFASSPSVFRGIGHLRGHETDRIAGLVTNIRSLGGQAEETEDGLKVIPQSLHGGTWKAFSDHRMATAGALVGLVVPGVMVDDIGSTAKTIPEFPMLWGTMVGAG